MTANISWNFQAKLRELIEFSVPSPVGRGLKQYDSPKNACVGVYIRLNCSELIYQHSYDFAEVELSTFY